jgi:hypothetical protein
MSMEPEPTKLSVGPWSIRSMLVSLWDNFHSSFDQIPSPAPERLTSWQTLNDAFNGERYLTRGDLAQRSVSVGLVEANTTSPPSET